MSNGPGLYNYIGKKAQDLLYKDYLTDHKLTITYSSATEAVITSLGMKKGDSFFADVNTQLRNKNMTADIKIDSGSNLFTTITIDEAAPGLKTILSFRVPDHRSGKLELQYLHDYAGINTSIGLTANPIINFSGVVGTNVLSLGTDVSFDTNLGTFSKCNAGLSFTKANLAASLNLNDKGDTLSASYHHKFSLVNFAVGVEVAHSFSTKEFTFGAGTHCQLDQLNTVKTKIDKFGRTTALLLHEWHPNTFFIISSELDTGFNKKIKYGLTVAVNPETIDGDGCSPIFIKQAIRKHGFVNILDNPGTADLSAYVDFAAIRNSAEEASDDVAVHGPMTQSQFLGSLGINFRVETLMENCTDEQVDSLRTGYWRLVGEGEAPFWEGPEEQAPIGMGTRYLAMTIVNKKQGVPIPFQ